MLRIRIRRLASVALISLTLSLAAAARAQTRYTVTDLGSLGGDITYAYDVNSSGQVSGAGNLPDADATYSAAARWQDGILTRITPDPATWFWFQSTAEAINDSGMMAGWFNGCNFCSVHAARWVDGVAEELPPYQNALANDVNELGQIAGTLFGATHAVIWNADLSRVDLGTLGGFGSSGYGINDAGHVVGAADTGTERHAFLYDGERMIDLGTFGGRFQRESIAYAINERGQVVGRARKDSVERGFVWTAEGGLVDLGDLGFGTALGTAALDVNESGTIVGYSQGPTGRTAVVWDSTGIHDLETLIPAGAGWSLLQAHSINDFGQIVGIGTGPTSESSAFLLTPIELEMESPVRVRAGETNTIAASGATPGRSVTFVWGKRAGATSDPLCPGGASILVSQPRRLGIVPSDPLGVAALELFVASRFRGARFQLQAAERARCRVSAPVELIVE